jgi:hypothetical protein
LSEKDSISFRINDDDSISMKDPNDSNKEITWGEYKKRKTSLSDNDYQNNVPIEIVKVQNIDGVPQEVVLGYVHNIFWINSYNTTDVEGNVENLVHLRKKIIENINKSSDKRASGYISLIEYGVAAKRINDGQGLKISMEEAALTVPITIANRGSIEGYTVINSIKDGHRYAIVEGRNNTKIAIPIDPVKISALSISEKNDVQNTVFNMIMDWFYYSNDNDYRSDFVQKVIDKSKQLEDFVSIEALILDEIRDFVFIGNRKDILPQINLIGGSINFKLKGKDLFINPATSKADIVQYSKKLNQTIGEMFINLQNSSLKTNKTVYVNGKAISYDSLVRKSHETNLIFHRLSDNRYTVFIQPSIRFELSDKINVVKETSETKKPSTSIDKKVIRITGNLGKVPPSFSPTDITDIYKEGSEIAKNCFNQK